MLTEANTDAELLESFAITRSDEAFAAIVRRHVNLVYATTVRRVKDPHLAEDVTQAVFFVLSKKAMKLPRSTVLAGWLYQTACFVSADAIKMKMRREHHEREGAILRRAPAAADAWENISPHLETALDALGKNRPRLDSVAFL